MTSEATTVSETTTLSDATTLSYDRTVDRRDVNRRAVSEVLLTDFRPLTEEACLFGAQLPLYHPYYSDHLTDPEQYDLLLLLECCRQAATYSGYRHFGIARGTTNLVSALDIDIADPGALAAGPLPGEALLEVGITDKDFTGLKRRATLVVGISIGERYAGQARITASSVTERTFRALRRRQRTSEPALSVRLPDVPDGEPVPPFLVGRRHPANVVLTDAVVTGRSATARLGLTPRNRSILDHDYDHFPAMSLVEAGRQAGLLAVTAGSADPAAAVTRLHMTRLSGTFGRFAELDSPVTVTALPDPATPEGRLPARIECTQDDNVVASLTVAFSPTTPLAGRPHP